MYIEKKANSSRGERCLCLETQHSFPTLDFLQHGELMGINYGEAALLFLGATSRKVRWRHLFLFSAFSPKCPQSALASRADLLPRSTSRIKNPSPTNRWTHRIQANLFGHLVLQGPRRPVSLLPEFFAVAKFRLCQPNRRWFSAWPSFV